MKKLFVFTLSFILLYSLNACGASSTAITADANSSQTSISSLEAMQDTLDTDDPEILRAVAYGFVPDELLTHRETAITFSQYSGMMKAMLSSYDKSTLSRWDSFTSNVVNNSNPMKRNYGILMTYYAGSLMGIGKTSNGDWESLTNIGIDMIKDFDVNYASLFPDSTTIAPFYDQPFVHMAGWNYIDTARLWILGQTSVVSGKLIFDVDYENLSLRPKDNFTREEAIHAVLRLYESALLPKNNLSATDTKSTEILEKAENRKEAILNSPTEIIKSDTFIQGQTYTASAYYISNSGDDNNDGKSPETPWATIKKLNQARLNKGDAVFFKRGDIWYDEIHSLSGVTYSAYGSGPKPTFSGSVDENAADPEKWSLVYSGQNGEKIWVYYRDILEVTGVFFDNGQSWANKVFPYWDDINKQYIIKVGQKFEINTGLTNDLDFFSDIDLTQIDPFTQVNETGITGSLYLRCDSGNPGEVYKNIEFSQDKKGILPALENSTEITIDNLKFVYYGAFGIGAGWKNVLVQNNEIGWSGGEIYAYSVQGNNRYANAQTSGCAIQLTGSGHKAINNYIHDSGSKSVVVVIHLSYGEPYFLSDIQIKGNLFEYNSSALHLANYLETEQPDTPSGFKDIFFEDNYVLYSGFGWVDINNQRSDLSPYYSHSNAIDLDRFCKNRNEGIYISNNIFYMAKYALIYSNIPETNQPIFSGNTYAQSENGWLAMFQGRMLSITENGEQYIREELKDPTGTLLVVK